MARITPIDVIKGISGKYGNGSNDYFATNSSSNRIHLAKYVNKPTGPASQDQLDQMDKFGTQQKLAAAWLRANRPTNLKAAVGTREHDGTEAYLEAQSLKKQMHLSNVRQVILKYLDVENATVTLPATGSQTVTLDAPADTPDDTPDDTPTGGQTVTKYTLSLSASPAEGGTVSGAGEYNAGQQVEISAEAATGYTFSQWNDGNTSATRTVTLDGNKELTASFVVQETNPQPGTEGGGGMNLGE